MVACHNIILQFHPRCASSPLSPFETSFDVPGQTSRKENHSLPLNSGKPNFRSSAPAVQPVKERRMTPSITHTSATGLNGPHSWMIVDGFIGSHQIHNVEYKRWGQHNSLVMYPIPCYHIDYYLLHYQAPFPFSLSFSRDTRHVHTYSTTGESIARVLPLHSACLFALG